MRFKVLMLAALLCALPFQAHGAYECYLRIKGAKQGDIKGSVTQKGREGMIRVIDFDYSVISPRDPASGLATGKRMHKPLTVTMELDRATPLLFQCIAGNETLTDVTLEIWGPQMKAATGTGILVKVAEITLKNGGVASFHTKLVKGESATEKDLLVAEVMLTFQTITITYPEGGTTGFDSWEGNASMPGVRQMTLQPTAIGKA